MSTGKSTGGKGTGKSTGDAACSLPVQHADMTAARELLDDVPSEASGPPVTSTLVESHLILW